jgi:hypothetical protein
MPLIYVDVIEGRTPGEIQTVLDAIHEVVVEARALTNSFLGARHRNERQLSVSLWDALDLFENGVRRDPRERTGTGHTKTSIECCHSVRAAQTWWPGAGSNRRPSAFQAEAKSKARRLCWSSRTNWTNLEGQEHAIQISQRMRSGWMRTNP